VFAPDGSLVRRFGEQGIWAGQLQRPKGIAIDSQDHVYVTDSAFDNFQIFDADGQLLLVVGETGTGAGQFNVPSMITIDSQDRIFVTDFGFHRVQVFQYLRDQ
jgi:DNA-binding beta-propeller fold protein YncE